MYDQSFRNQAVKECVNGQSLRSTAMKYGIAETTLRIWIVEYRERMVEISGLKQGVTEVSNFKNTVPAILGADIPHKEEAVVEESVVVLNSVNVTVDGHDITISKRDVVKLMEVFYHFDKKEGKRDDV